MIIIPAIDLKDGQAVRLYQGDYHKQTIYSSYPHEVALQFENMGVDYLHVVDLDGAKDGVTANLAAIQKIRETVHLPIELGGGIRHEQTVDLYLDQIGIDRVILGTVALKEPQFLKKMLKKYGSQRIVVGVDIKEGYVATAGWLQQSQVYYLDFLAELERLGVRYIVCTDISKDGTLQGPSFDLYQKIKQSSSLNCIVSGGVKDAQDVYEAARQGYYGCIIGKAYYEGKIDIKEVIRCLPNVLSHV